jgi:hypothetical protein
MVDLEVILVELMLVVVAVVELVALELMQHQDALEMVEQEQQTILQELV